MSFATNDGDERERWAAQRHQMVYGQIARAGVRDRRVLAAMDEVPRQLFVPKHLRYAAHADSPLPIGDGQTISQPLMVALMVQALELSGDERVLDVGGGSGYQAAVISRLCREVVSIELRPELAEHMRQNLADAGIDNVRVVVGDGSEGYPPAAPYDAIVVAAAAPSVPPPLTEQLAAGGRLVVPVGDRVGMQQLVRARRTEAGVGATEQLDLCAFVPLLGRYGFRD